ncbi:hypothetical protein MLD38_037909 [Melastoma candidum]|uniref:Uncharacterized protein n=1 Tax=Melastoma candidum TaxID=119954 RepID=A0ACB9KXD4_9MYRT|nr:hypothetical protein MLD38_037909 [Melastoma candidum]
MGGGGMKVGWLLVATSLLVLVAAKPDLPRFHHPSDKPDGSLRVMVIGDWGRRGLFNQSLVAHQMGILAEKMDMDFIISTGDNFYEDGLTGIMDMAFKESFVDIYTARSLQKQWYSVLGNHDYRGDVEAQLSPVLRQMDTRWLCLRSFVVDSEIVDFVFVDTTPFVDKYFNKPGKSVYDWSGVLPREQYLSVLLNDVDLALKESTAKWKVVVGHHTIKSAGEHGNTRELGALLLPILQANHVDLYINGHDHCLQHISTVDSSIQFLTSGGGSKSWRGIVGWPNPKELKFYYDGQGFMTLEMSPIDIRAVFYDIHGNILHTWSNGKSLLSAI